MPFEFSAARWTMAATAVFVGSALISLAIPRSFGAWAAMEGDGVFARLGKAQPPSIDELDIGARAYRRAVAWEPSGERMVHLAAIENAQAQTTAATAPGRGKHLEQAECHLAEGLSRNPVSGYGWLLLASVRQQRGAPRREIVRAVVQSLEMSPMTRYLWLPRARALFLYASELEQEELAYVQAHLRILWSADPSLRQLLLIAAFNSGNLRLLSTGLGSDAEARVELNKLMISTPLN